MASSTRPASEPKRWHVVVFAFVTGLLTLLALAGGVPDLLALPGQPGFPSAIHRWHEAQSGALLVILFGGSLLALLLKPKSRPLLMQYLVLSIGLLCVAFTFASGAGIQLVPVAVGFVFIVILAAVYPWSHALLDTSREGSMSYPMLAFTLIAAVVLVPTIAGEVHNQVVGFAQRDEHAQNYHWLTSSVLASLLLLGGAMAATKRPGWQPIGSLVGLAYLYLGSLALVLPGYVGSWGTAGGGLGLLGGLGYVGLTAWEAGAAARVLRLPLWGHRRSVAGDARSRS